MNMGADGCDSLSHRIRQVMMQWDPIGIQSFPEAQDEYDAYIPEVQHLLLSNATFDKLFAYLWALETLHMQLPGDIARTTQCAQLLIEAGAGCRHSPHDHA